MRQPARPAAAGDGAPPSLPSKVPLLGVISVLATLVGVDKKRRVLVAFGDGAAPVPARFGTHLDPGALRRAIAARQQALVLPPGEDRPSPVIIGLVQESLDAEPRIAAGTLAAASVAQTSDGAPELDAQVDGRRVHILAEDEIVLQCGKASITLRRNGRVVVRGTHVQTDSDGVNIVRGAQVRIN